MKVWLITDTHFNHDNIKTYCKRPDDFTERIIRNWQRLVKPEDCVIHLGDVAIGNRRAVDSILTKLPGRKALIRGNHDSQHSNTWWMKHGFDFACDSMVFRNVWLTHAPWLEPLPAGTVINVHGHIHTRAFTEKKPWNKLLILEHHYSPVEFNKFVNSKKTMEFQESINDV